MKRTFAIVICIAAIFSVWGFLNSKKFIIAMAEQELKPVIQHGTKKEVLIKYLEKVGRGSYETTGRNSNGICQPAGGVNFHWNCEYSSYAHTGWETGFMNPFSPFIEVFFVFNEKNELVNYYTEISYTFL